MKAKSVFPEVLILGIGNELLTDDAIGPFLIHELEEYFKSNPQIKFETACCGGLQILETIVGYKKVILIDAIKSKNGKLGEVLLLSPEDFEETSNLSSLHDLSFLDALKLGKHLDFKMPQEIKIIAIQIFEDRMIHDQFSNELKSVYPEVLMKVKDFLTDILVENYKVS